MVNMYKVSNNKITKVVLAASAMEATHLFRMRHSWGDLHNESGNIMYEICAELIFEDVIVGSEDE